MRRAATCELPGWFQRVKGRSTSSKGEEMQNMRTALVLVASLLFTGPLFAQERDKKAKLAPRTYGTGNTSFYRIGASEFSLLATAVGVEYSDMYLTAPHSRFRRFATNDSGYYFVGTPHLPSGAKLIAANLHSCVEAENNIHGELLTCNNYGSSCSGIGVFPNAVGCGYDHVDLSSSGYVVDNSPDGNYLVILLSTVTNGPDSFAGVTIEYQLQVSPPPALATFADVPTSHPQFQFIEALAASGITAGCGGGNYCPGATLTRGQMAVFLAKALGLQFP